MVRRRNLLVCLAVFIILFVLTTNYLLNILTASESKVKKLLTIEEKIYLELQNLPAQYNLTPLSHDIADEIFTDDFKYKNTSIQKIDLVNLWQEVNSWVSKTQVVNFQSPNFRRAFYALKSAKIIKADVDTRGTQLKLLLTLQVTFYN